jgi:hypothetical protein
MTNPINTTTVPSVSITTARTGASSKANFFIVGGQFAYVAEKGEAFQSSSGQPDARLRLVYANGTESNLLMRSLQKALTMDSNGRRLSEPSAGPLFGDTAENDATYLLAPVEVVAEHKLHNLSRVKMENIFHRLFGAAQLDLTIEDRFGKPVKPREWFLVPLGVIDEAVERIRNGSIAGITYDPRVARLVGLP